MSETSDRPIARGLTRRDVVLRRWREDGWLPEWMASKTFGLSLIVAVAFWLIAGGVAAWTRDRPLLAVGQVMPQTVIARVPVSIVDELETARRRELARMREPRVYLATPTLAEVQESLRQLPRTLSAATKLEDVAMEIRTQFGLDEESLQSIRTEADQGQVSAVWDGRVKAFIDAMNHRPILEDLSWQRESQEGRNAKVELRAIDQTATLVLVEDLLTVKEPARIASIVNDAAQRAGMNPAATRVVRARMLHDLRPTFAFDEAATLQSQSAAEGRIPMVRREITRGQTLVERGEKLSSVQADAILAERTSYRAQAEWWKLGLRPLSVGLICGAITLAGACYLGLFCPSAMSNVRRIVALAAMVLGTLLVALLGTTADPSLLAVTATAPTLLLTAILTVAYGQRVALALGVLHSIMVSVALALPIAIFAVLIMGVSVMVWHFRDVRDRRGLVRAAGGAAVAMAIGMLLASMIDAPLVPATVSQTARDAALAAFGALLVSGLMFFILPTIERLFDVTTGMTLMELRDPRQPLLRQLQQQAPGTYNHSLNVASIAESAAEAIGADSLLTYVGALYHDIGKMNKPDYFIENMGLSGDSGINRHDKLSPAMSLLVIVGHVKDGMAMAEEADLPPNLQHFIAAHHGTTVVEYFYTRAKQQAERSGGDNEGPEEIEYRYPGPKPKTKEVAILMLADAIESATRSLAEPTPSRIDALVRAVANARLMDGQFDDCEMSLRELHTIADSISKSVAAIYHGRIKYPSTVSESQNATASGEKRA